MNNTFPQHAETSAHAGGALEFYSGILNMKNWNKIKRYGAAAVGAGVVGVSSVHAADPADLDALQTAIASKFTSIETIVISGFVLGMAIVVGTITMHWVNRGARGKVK